MIIPEPAAETLAQDPHPVGIIPFLRQPQPRTFYPRLEGLRGLAILLVLLSHFVIIEHFPKLGFLNLGFWGVNLFFVLSGFLITEILLRDIYAGQRIGRVLKAFYLRRILRIFPIYYLTILALAVFGVHETQRFLTYTLTYSYNLGSIWSKAALPGILSPTWSLCVEEQFYLLWPLVLVSVPKKLYKYVFSLTVLAAIVTRILYLEFGHGNQEAFCHSFTVASSDALGLGALLAFWKMTQEESLRRFLTKAGWIPFIVAAAFWIISRRYSGDHFLFLAFGRLLCSMAAFCLVGIGAFSIPTVYGRIFDGICLRFVGRISYGMYIYHWVLYSLLRKEFFTWWGRFQFTYCHYLRYNSWLGAFVLFSLLTIGVSALSFYFIEKPLLRLKEAVS
jgi:peptidoglycan/LPS O-acetylase OafA/YrhL